MIKQQRKFGETITTEELVRTRKGISYRCRRILEQRIIGTNWLNDVEIGKG